MEPSESPVDYPVTIHLEVEKGVITTQLSALAAFLEVTLADTGYELLSSARHRLLRCNPAPLEFSSNIPVDLRFNEEWLLS